MINIKTCKEGMYLEASGIRLTRIYERISPAQNMSSLDAERLVACSYKGRITIREMRDGTVILRARKDVTLTRMSLHMYAITYYKNTLKGKIKVTRIVGLYGKKILTIENDENNYEFFNKYMKIKINGKYGYMNWLGHMILPPKYDTATNFQNDKAYVTFMDGDIKRCWIIDRSGESILGDPKYNYISRSYNGTTLVLNTETRGKNLLDSSLQPLFKGVYSNMVPLNEKLIKVADKAPKRTGIIDYSENIIVPLICNMVYESKHKGYYYVVDRENNYGVIDSEGNIVIEVKHAKKDIIETEDAFLVKFNTIKVIDKK